MPGTGARKRVFVLGWPGGQAAVNAAAAVRAAAKGVAKKAGAKLAALTSFPHGGAAEKGKGRGRGRGRGKLDPTRGKVYKGRPNALSSDTMKAQRGRRGLISFGEVTYIFVLNEDLVMHSLRSCLAS